VYLERARTEPKRCRVIDSTAPRDAVEGEVARIVAALTP
jgi:hypothetical protein